MVNNLIKSSAFYFNHWLSYLENISSINKKYKFSYFPIFIIGAPRSGTTLLYQLFAKYTNLGYFSNFHHYFHGCPYMVEPVLKCMSRYHGNLESRYGYTSGLSSPSEGGHFWYRFFMDCEDSQALFSDKDLLYLRRSLYLLLKFSKTHVIFKNTLNSMRIKGILSAVPESLFIILHRNSSSNAESILKARCELMGSYDQWWSVKTHSYTSLVNLPPHEQVLKQIQEIYHEINSQLENVSDRRYINIDYEDLCSQPQSTLEFIRSYFSNQGVSFEIKDIPESATKPSVDEKQKNIESV